MIEVYIKQLREAIDDYKDILEALEENNTAIIHNFNDLSKHWQDDRISRLNANFSLESCRILNLEKNIKSQLAIYQEVENGYSKIGSRVKCNLSKQDLLNLKLDNIINKLNAIINRYNSLGDIMFYPRAYMIYSQKRQMISILNEFKKIKASLNDKFNEIKEIENLVQKRTAAVKIQNITVNNYEREE